MSLSLYPDQKRDKTHNSRPWSKKRQNAQLKTLVKRETKRTTQDPGQKRDKTHNSRPWSKKRQNAQLKTLVKRETKRTHTTHTKHKTHTQDHEVAFNTFLKYKVKVPVCGAVLLNSDLTKVLLVRGYLQSHPQSHSLPRWKKTATWGFPRGKINQDESETSCGIREVFEECGFDISPYLRANEYVGRRVLDQRIKLFIIAGIDESVQFHTRTRNEIGVSVIHAN